MPKLLQLNSSVGRGSTGRIAETIASIATERGWTCHIAHGARYVGASQMETYLVSSKGAEIAHYVKSVLLDAHGLGSVSETKRLVAWIEELHPDVIQIHNLHGYWVNYEILFHYLREADIPVVWTLHDCWAITGHCAMFTSAFCDRWQKGCTKCPHLAWYPRSIFFDRAKKSFQKKKELFTSLPNLTVVSVSNWLNSIIEQSFLKDTPHMVIPNGVDTSVFYPRWESIKRTREKYGLCDKVIVLSVADKWNEGIGFSDIPKLRALLDERFAVVVVGVSQSQKETLPEGVTGILHTSNREELAELYTAADISFTPQTVATFGLVSAESMACGTPAVVYAASAAEVINNNGFVVPARDVQMLAATIIKFAENGGKKQYSAACVERVKNEYEERTNYNRYLDLYESLIL